MMLILALKPGHDGGLAAIEDGKLLFSLEAEKDSFPRFDRITPEVIIAAGKYLNKIPDVIAVSGWVKGWHSVERVAEAGYFGCEETGIINRTQNFMGKDVNVFSSTHERSHIMGAYGMSPFTQGTPVYVLVWEGNIGDFYEVDENSKVRHIDRVMTDPGNKYSTLFMIADPTFPGIKGHFRFQDAGKLMALAAYSNREPTNKEEARLISFILESDGLLLANSKEDYKWSSFYNIGVQSKEFKNLAGKFSDELFHRFYTFARKNLTKGYPLLISGGCGLNCEWNTKWAECGLFESIFVPPCPNDSGSAIGTAIDAQLFHSGNSKIDWTVYSGEEFVEDLASPPLDFKILPLDTDLIASYLQAGEIIAWVQGRYEIGPRALGNRSLLAAPFSENVTERLNQIKSREEYRPIAPICLEEDVSKFFDRDTSSPFMLYFNKVLNDKLKAVTHVDGSARVQTVSEKDNLILFQLLQAFKRRSDFGVLCNTSLNFNGRGFINRTSDLLEYCTDRGINVFVVNSKIYLRNVVLSNQVECI